MRIVPATTLALLVLFPFSSLAQAPINLPNPVEESLTPELETPTLPENPPAPALLPSDPTPADSDLPGSDISFPIQTIQVTGNSILQAEIDQLTAPLEGQTLTLSDLLTLRSAITQLYIDNGYITSGAFLPNNQDLSSGTVTLSVIEGSLEDLQINGLQRLRPDYVRSRLNRATASPLNRADLEQSLQLLQLDPLLRRVDAELTAGSRPGTNLLILDLEEARAFHAGLSFDNYRSPSIGSLQGQVNLSHDNLLGWGDRFSANYGRTEGLDLYSFDYSIPWNAQGGTLDLGYSNSDSNIIEDDFEDLDINSESRTISLGLRQPIVKTPRSEFALGLGFDLKRSQSFILGDRRFSFSPGTDRGESKVSVLNFSQDWTRRGARRVLAGRSQFNLGLDAFDATVNDIGTDGRFFSWVGQFQWVEQFSPRFLLVSRLDTQLTPDSLLSSERFSLGGLGTVRGYSQNATVADSGILASLEARIPITRNPNRLQLTPFVEGGTAWNNKFADADPANLISIGLGARWQAAPGLNLRADYGIPLINGDREGSSLQENGFTFSVNYQPW